MNGNIEPIRIPDTPTSTKWVANPPGKRKHHAKRGSRKSKVKK